MNNAIVIQQAYNGREWLGSFIPALELVEERHLSYCRKWKIDYMSVIGEVREDYKPNTGGWAKIELVLRALEKGYSYVAWIDADAMIVDMNTDLRSGCPDGVGMVLHDGQGTPGPHLNVGIMLMKNSDKVREFYEELAKRYPGTNEFPWFEQGEANKMSKEPKWKDVVFKIDNKWNSCLYAKTHVDDAVIEAWHGMGDPAQRTAQMQAYLQIIKRKEENERSNNTTNSSGHVTG
jgi:hypothetical protein